MNKLALVLLITVIVAAAPLAHAVEPFIGEYEGVCHLLGYPELPAKATVMTEGPALYRTLIQFTGPAGQFQDIEVHGLLEGARINFSTVCQAVWWRGELVGEDLVMKRLDDYGIDFVLKRVIRKSPTEGLAPPEKAIVLIPFKENTPPDMSAWQHQKWEPQADGSVQVKPGTGNNLTKESFGSCRIHLELNLPHMPTAEGQGRANSGLYIQNRFECQILDSFGVLAGAGDCGAFYQVAAPRINASLPPGQWQTYDIEFHAPKYNADGSIKDLPRVTVEHNGVKIHDNCTLPKETPGGMPLANGQDKGPMLLQDHGNPVRFRNMWIVPIQD